MTSAPFLSGRALADCLLRPRSIALVGASDDATKTASRPQQYLRRAGYQGTVYPINPKRTSVLGARAWPSLASLPEVPDHVFVLSPTQSVVDTVEQCAQLGVPLVTVLASGFAEAGADGRDRERALVDIGQRAGIRILGPSSIGVVNLRNGLVLTANAAFAESDLPVGQTFVASHSGSMIGALVSRGKARGVGFAGLVSVGAEADLSIGEICAATLDDPDIHGYLLFLESLHHGDALRRFARGAAERGKAVVAYKLGRTSAAAEMSVSHTGAIAGEDDIADAFLKDCGIARVETLDALLETLPLARQFPLARQASRRVGVVTTTGAGAAMAVDQLGARGILVEAPSAQTLARLGECGINASPGRVVDLTLAGVKYEVMKAALDVLLAAPEFDLVLATIGSSARFQPDLAVKPIIDSAHGAKPLAAMLVPDAPEALARLTQAEVPCFRSPESCADAIAAVFKRRRPPENLPPAAIGVKAGKPISEADGYKLLQGLGVAIAPYYTAPLAGPWPDPAFGFPVVVKVCSAQIPHKTEVGGVVLGVGNATELTRAVGTLRTNLSERAPAVRCDEVLIQRSTKGLAEVLVGYRVDADAGPIIILAAGGVWAEVAQDRSIRLAPVTVDTALEMIAEVRALRILTGLRGMPRGDADALARTICALSQLALRPELGVQEAEINPLMVMPEHQGVLAVDALVVVGAG
ncbi:MAG: acetate--CoA ligase family protein [Burkholderiaceae bacterium]|nr:acetate--CoA ligase family protein [Burkholderiaceae bacterium]